jgi:hypothetical protein
LQVLVAGHPTPPGLVASAVAITERAASETPAPPR